MEVRKVRGQNKLKPIRMTSVEYNLAIKMGLTVEQYVNEYVKLIAKQRRWKWWFEKQAQKGSEK